MEEWVRLAERWSGSDILAFVSILVIALAPKSAPIWALKAVRRWMIKRLARWAVKWGQSHVGGD